MKLDEAQVSLAVRALLKHLKVTKSSSDLLDEAIKSAAKVAAMSRPISMMVKESVNRAYETTLAEGVLFERRTFHSVFATKDQTEGMKAFVEKRKPDFKNR